MTEFRESQVDYTMEILRKELASIESRVVRLIKEMIEVIEFKDNQIEKLTSEVLDLKTRIEMLEEERDKYATGAWGSD